MFSVSQNSSPNPGFQALTVFGHSHGIAPPASLATEYAFPPKSCRHRSVLARLGYNCHGYPSLDRDGERSPRGHLAVYFPGDRSRRHRRSSASLLFPRLRLRRQ